MWWRLIKLGTHSLTLRSNSATLAPLPQNERCVYIGSHEEMCNTDSTAPNWRETKHLSMGGWSWAISTIDYFSVLKRTASIFYFLSKSQKRDA